MGVGRRHAAARAAAAAVAAVVVAAVAAPGPARADGAKPGGAKPGGAKPGGAKPGGAKPDGAKPGGAKPDGAKPDGAKPERPKPEGAKLGGARPDWARGLVIATGVGVADRHAPSPVNARGPAHEAALAAARKQLAAALPALPLAGGGTLAGRLGDTAVKARVDRAIAAAILVDAEPSTDGSWRVSLGVPIEAIRQALTGPRAAPASDVDGPPVVVVEGARATPAIGYKLGPVAAPAIWVKDVPAWAKDAPRVKALSTSAGAIELADTKGAESTLFVIVEGR